MSPSPVLNRRQVLRGGAAAGLAGVAPALTGCGDSGNSDALRIVVQGSAADTPIWKAMIKRFLDRHPGIKMEPIFLAGPTGSDSWTGFFSTVQTRIVGGQKYDLLCVPTEGQLLFASRNVMQPLDEYLARDKVAMTDYRKDVDPKVLEQFRSHRPADGKTYYQPFGDNTECMWYSKPIFKAAGVPEPDPDWTWEDMEKVATKVGKPGKVFALAFATDLFGYMPWLLSNGADVLNADWTRSVIKSAAAIEALEFTRSFVARKLAPPPGGTFDMFTAMQQGKLAMFIGGRWPVSSFRAAHYSVDKLGIVPFPRKVRSASSVGYAAIGMFKSSTKKDQAWEFIKYTLSSDFAEYHAHTAFQGSSPVRRSAATGPAMLQDSPAGTQYLYKALSVSTVVPGVANQAQLADPFSKTISQILAGTTEVEPAVDLLDQQLAANLHA